MVYKVIVSLSAEKEIEGAIDYYSELSVDVPAKFLYQIEETYLILSDNPFFRIRYKNIRAVPVKGFPFMLFYSVIEDRELVIIYSCFHTAKSPRKYPK